MWGGEKSNFGVFFMLFCLHQRAGCWEEPKVHLGLHPLKKSVDTKHPKHSSPALRYHQSFCALMFKISFRTTFPLQNFTNYETSEDAVREILVEKITFFYN